MIACPICGREMPVTPHYRREAWSAQQLWLVRRLRATGISQKAVARVLGCHSRSIASLEARLRREQRSVAA
jgi:transcriptional regulator